MILIDKYGNDIITDKFVIKGDEVQFVQCGNSYAFPIWNLVEVRDK